MEKKKKSSSISNGTNSVYISIYRRIKILCLANFLSADDWRFSCKPYFFLYLLRKIVILYHWLAWWPLSNRTDKELVFSFSLHWKHHLNLLYLLILISTLKLYCFMILHVIEIGQWIYSGEKKFKGGTASQPSHITPAVFLLQGKKTLKKRRMLQWLA